MQKTKTKKVKRGFRMGIHSRDNISLSIMILPTIVLLFLFNYLPMFGSILAFKDYRYNLGVFGSKWVGFDNFKYFFTSNDAFVIIRNTVLYNMVFIACDVFFGILVALLLYEVRQRAERVSVGSWKRMREWPAGPVVGKPSGTWF